MNKNKNSKTMLILSILLLLFIVIGTATAADDKLANETVSTTTNDDGVDTLNTEVDSVDEKAYTTTDTLGSTDANNNSKNILGSQNEDKLKDSEDVGTFSQLNEIIKLTDGYYKLTKNYNYSSTDTQSIIIAKNNFILDGDNFTIDANLQQIAFTITGNNVTLKNLNIINSQGFTSAKYGSITWTGNAGNLINTSLKNSVAIYWTGNDANIDTLTLDNMLSVLNDGFLIYFKGINVNLKNSKFKNTESDLARMGLFFDSICLGENTVKNCTFNNLTRKGNAANSGIVFVRGCEVTIDGCYFYNCSSATGIIFSTGTTTVLNSHFEDINPTYVPAREYMYNAICNAYLVDNCTFKNYHYHTEQGTSNSIVGSKTVKDCTFINTTGINSYGSYNNYIVKVSEIVNCTFMDLQSTAVDIESGSITNCTFKDNNISDDYLINIDSGSKFIVSGNNFANNNSAKKALIYIADNITCNIYNNTIDKSQIINNGTSFVMKNRIYVSDNPTGDGLTNLTSTSLEDALANIEVGGTIIILNGTHNISASSFDNRYILNFNIEGRNNVVLDTQYIELSSFYNIKNIIFTNVSNIRLMGHNTLKNITVNKYIYDSGFSLFLGYAAFNSTLSDITLKNLDLNGKSIFTFATSQSGQEFMGRWNVNNVHVENCTNIGYIFATRAVILSTVDTVTVKNSSLSSLHIIFSISGYSSGSEFKHIIVDNCSAKQLFYIQNSATTGGVSYNDITVNDTTVTNVIVSNYNCVFDDVKIDNVSSGIDHSIIYFDQDSNTIKNSKFSNINNSMTIIYSGGNSVVDNVTIEDSNALNGINALSTTLTDVTIKDSNFTNTIASLGANCILHDSTFKNLNCSVNVTGGDVNIERCTFESIKSVNGSLNIAGENCFIQSCNFTNNNALECGGAIYIQANSSQILQSQFSNNIAGSHGGAIFVTPGTFYYKDELSTELEEESDAEGDSPKNNGLYRVGYMPTYSEIFIAPNETDHDNIRKSVASAFGLVNPNGKIISLYGNDYYEFSEGKYAFAKSNVTIIGKNTTVKINGHLTVGPYGSNLTVYNITFKDAPDHAIVWYGENGKLINCTFQDNIISQGATTEELYGCALVIQAPGMTIINSTFKNNRIEETVDIVGGSCIFLNSTDLTLDNCTFEDNVANNANTIYITENGRNVEIKKSHFINNREYNNNGKYGSIVVYGSNVTITDCEFKGNNIHGNGSVLMVNNIIGLVNLNNNNFTNNTAGNGGAIYIVSNPDAVLGNNRFINNTASVSGGAIYSNALLTVIGGEFTNNTATNGGAIYAYRVNADDVIFTNNTATNGGALYLTGNSVLNRVTFVGNRADHGSAIYMDTGKLELNSVNLTNNTNTGNEKCTVHVTDSASLSVADDVLFLSKDASGAFNQFICGDYKLDILYVSPSGIGSGWFSESPASLTTETFNHLNDNAKVIFLNNGDVYNVDNAVVIDGLKNIALVGNGSTIRINNKDKSLFIPRITPKLLSMKKVKKVLLIQIIFYHFPSCKNPPFYEFAQQ